MKFLPAGFIVASVAAAAFFAAHLKRSQRSEITSTETTGKPPEEIRRPSGERSETKKRELLSEYERFSRAPAAYIKEVKTMSSERRVELIQFFRERFIEAAREADRKGGLNLTDEEIGRMERLSFEDIERSLFPSR